MAAFLADYTALPSSAMLSTLRESLSQLLPDTSLVQIKPPVTASSISPSDSASTSPSQSQDQEDTNSASLSSSEFYNSPFGFLQSIFPRTPAHVIESTLASAGWVKSISPHSSEKSASISGDDESSSELNMDVAINLLLSEEWIREVMERGYVAGEEGDPTLSSLAPPNAGGGRESEDEERYERKWERVQKNDKKSGMIGNVDTNGLGPRKGKRIKPGTIDNGTGAATATGKGLSSSITIPLFDIRQRQHAPPSRSSGPRDFVADPWVYFASLASQLSRLTEETAGEEDSAAGYTRFLAMFHDPSYATPAKALRAWLMGQYRLKMRLVPPLKSGKNAKPRLSNAHIVTEDQVSSLLELVPPPLRSSSITADDLKSWEDDTRQDARACISATRGRMEDALDLMLLLRELDAKGGAVVLHSAPRSRPFGVVEGIKEANIPLPKSPIISNAAAAMPPSPIPSSASVAARFPGSQSAPTLFASPPPSPSKPFTNKSSIANANQQKGWEMASPKRPRPVIERPSEGLAAFIPAYDETNQRAKARAANRAAAKIVPRGLPTVSAPLGSATNGNGSYEPAKGNGGIGGFKKRAAGSDADDVVAYRRRAEALRAKRDEVRVTSSFDHLSVLVSFFIHCILHTLALSGVHRTRTKATLKSGCDIGR